jgi:hypothetical protein
MMGFAAELLPSFWEGEDILHLGAMQPATLDHRVMSSRGHAKKSS